MSEVIRVVKTFTIDTKIVEKLRQLAFNEKKKQNEIIEEALIRLFEERIKNGN